MRTSASEGAARVAAAIGKGLPGEVGSSARPDGAELVSSDSFPAPPDGPEVAISGHFPAPPDGSQDGGGTHTPDRTDGAAHGSPVTAPQASGRNPRAELEELKAVREGRRLALLPTWPTDRRLDLSRSTERLIEELAHRLGNGLVPGLLVIDGCPYAPSRRHVLVELDAPRLAAVLGWWLDVGHYSPVVSSWVRVARLPEHLARTVHAMVSTGQVAGLGAVGPDAMPDDSLILDGHTVVPGSSRYTPPEPGTLPVERMPMEISMNGGSGRSWDDVEMGWHDGPTIDEQNADAERMADLLLSRGHSVRAPG